MYVFGGCTQSSCNAAFNDLWRLDLNSKEWIRPLASGERRHVALYPNLPHPAGWLVWFCISPMFYHYPTIFQFISICFLLQNIHTGRVTPAPPRTCVDKNHYPSAEIFIGFHNFSSCHWRYFEEWSRRARASVGKQVHSCGPRAGQENTAKSFPTLVFGLQMSPTARLFSLYFWIGPK